MQTDNLPHMEVGHRAIEGGSPVVHVVGSAVLAGAGLVGVVTGLGFFPMPPLDEPRWFVVWFGAVFVLAGFGKGVRAVPRCVKWLQALSQVRGDAAQAWRIDWPYGTDGVSDGLRAEVRNCYMGVAITAVFAWPVVTHTLVAGEWAWLHWVLFGIVAALLVAQLWRGIFLTVRLRHRGESYLRFAQCPYFLGEVLQATLVVGRGMARYETFTCTLRCVEQRTKYRGKNRRTVYVQVWSEVSKVAEQGAIAAGGEIPLAFVLPGQKGLSSRFSWGGARFWELEVHAAGPGPDLSCRFVVPVYAKADGVWLEMGAEFGIMPCSIESHP